MSPIVQHILSSAQVSLSKPSALLVRALCVAVLLALSTGMAAAARVGDGNVYYVSAGQGRTLIFVHGWTCDLSVWINQLAAFDDEYRVIALDLPGHGDSPPPPDGVYTMDLFADAVEAVRAAAGADEIVLVGHSMGVSVIRQYALRYPEHLTGLIAVDGFVPPPADDQQVEIPPPPTDERWREQMISNMFVPATSPALRAQIRTMMTRASDEQALAIAMSMRDPDRWTAGAVDVPMLAVMASTRDMPDAELYKPILPQLELVQLPETGHFLMLETPARLNELMRDFLAAIRYE